MTPVNSNPSLLVTQTVAGFFHELLEGACARLGLDFSLPVQTYLVHLLASWARGDPALVEHGALGPELIAALGEPDTARRRTRLKALGDRALYEGGYFSARLTDSVIDPKYLLSIGQDAYSRLSSEHRRTHLRALFSELAGRIGDCSQLLAEAAESGHHTPGSTLTDLYERWLVTRSRALADRLRAMGVIPVPPQKGQG